MAAMHHAGPSIGSSLTVITVAPVNHAELVANAHALVEQLGRKVATPADVRRRYGISPRIPRVTARVS